MHSDSTFSCACPQSFLSPGRKILRPLTPRDLLCLMSVAPVILLSQLPSSPHSLHQPSLPNSSRSLAPSSVGPSSAKPLPFSSPDLFLGPGGCVVPHAGVTCLLPAAVSSFRLFSPSTPVSGTLG